MNCDQAFDAMTDPDRPHGRELAQHLRACPRCRQMYETLEPALGLFAAVDGEPVGTVPAVPARLASAPVRLAQQIAARLSPAGNCSPSEPPRRRLWGAVFAAAVAGFLLSVGLGSLSPNSPTAAPGSTSACTWLNRDSIPNGERANAVVATCVTCHLLPPGDNDQHQTGIREFSRELEQLIVNWQAAEAPTRSSLNTLIALTKRGGGTNV
ncbi:MAG: anti-sigma factor [Planctomycetaceae bacterium]